MEMTMTRGFSELANEELILIDAGGRIDWDEVVQVSIASGVGTAAGGAAAAGYLGAIGAPVTAGVSIPVAMGLGALGGLVSGLVGGAVTSIVYQALD